MKDNLSADLASLKIDRTASPKSRVGLKLLLWLLGLGGLVAAVVVAKPYLEARVFKTPIELTQVALVSPAQASVEITASGYVEAEVTSKLAPKVPGRVMKVHIAQGDQVEAGQLLLELDPTDDKAAISAAQSRVAAALAQAAGAEARADTAQAELDAALQQAKRERRLADEGASPKATAEDLEARVKSLERAAQAARAQAKATRAEAGALSSQVDVLKTGLRNLELTAPIAGTVVNQPPQLGEYFGPQPPGISVDMGGIEIADFSTLLVKADVPEARLYLVKPDAPAEIVLDAFPDRRFRGKVKEITPEVDRAKATVAIKVAFVDDPKGVLPDMAARVSLLSKPLDAEAIKAKPKVVVPSSAVAERGGARVVFVVEEDRVRMVPVELGAPFGKGFELARGPGPGTQLVANPPATLADGQRVKQQSED